MKLQRLGGYAAIASICALLAGVLLFVFTLNSGITMMEAVSTAPGNLYAGYLLMVVFYILFVILALALHERMQFKAPYLTRLLVIAAAASAVMQMATAVIFIRQAATIARTQDSSAFNTLAAIIDGLDFTAGHLTAWTFLLSGCAIVRTGALSRALGWLSLITGVLWLPRFAVPQLGLVPVLLSCVVLLLSCVVTIWMGITLLKRQQPQPQSI